MLVHGVQWILRLIYDLNMDASPQVIRIKYIDKFPESGFHSDTYAFRAHTYR